MRRDPTPERRTTRRAPEPRVTVNAAPNSDRVVVQSGSPVVQKVNAVSEKPSYPAMAEVTKNVEMTRPSAPPGASEERRVRTREEHSGDRRTKAPVDSSEERREKRRTDPSDERQRERKVSKEKRTTKKDTHKEDVRRIRDAEGSNDPSATREREKVQDTTRRRMKTAKKERQGNQVKVKNYPTTVTWRREGESLSLGCFLIFAGFVSIVVLMGLAWSYYSVHIPDVSLDESNTSFTYKSVTYTSTSKSIPNNSGTSSDLTSTAPLILELLSIPNKPILDCGTGDMRSVDTNNLAAMNDATVGKFQYTTSESMMGAADTNSKRVTKLIFDTNTAETGLHGVVPGSYCTGSQYGVGYCVRDTACGSIVSAILPWSDGTTWSKGMCLKSLGPQRSGTKYVPGSFFELLTGGSNWLIAVVPAVGALVLGLIWASITAEAPVTSPWVMFVMGGLACAGVYIGGTVGLVDVTSNNYYILVYIALVALFMILTFNYQKRAGKVFTLGFGFLRGELNPAIEGEHRSARAIIVPALLFALFQTTTSILLILMVAAGTHVVYFEMSSALRTAMGMNNSWSDWINAPQAGYDDITKKAIIDSYVADCEFLPSIGFAAAGIVLSVFFMFSSIYTQYGTRAAVATCVADSYFAGTKKYVAPPGGESRKFGIAFSRAFFSLGSKVWFNGIFGYLGSSSVSRSDGIVALFIHMLVSPIEVLVYSVFGFIFGAVNSDGNRFGIIHSAMYPGDSKNPNAFHSNRMSKKLVTKSYGRSQAKLGDSPELRLLTISADLLAVGCGLVAWVWCDYAQASDSIAKLDWLILLILWLVGSAIQRPGIVAMVAIICDISMASLLPQIQLQAMRNCIMGFVIMASISATILRTFLEIPTSGTDTIAYCYAIERSKRRKIRLLKLEEIMHKDYLGDADSVPTGMQLERVTVMCPEAAKPNDSITIEVDAKRYEVKIPPGAKPGKDFEVAIAVPINNLDFDEGAEDEDDDYYDDDSEEEEDENGPGVVRNRSPEPPIIAASPPKVVSPTAIQVSNVGRGAANTTHYQY